jgi:hypothetical protein
MDPNVKPIRSESMMMTLVDPFRGYESKYNRWYEEDHFFGAVTLGPGVLCGTRFVARRQEKAARRAEPPFKAEAGSLLAMYWLQGDGKASLEWIANNVPKLRAEDRMFDERDLVFNFTGHLGLSANRPDVHVPVELALLHRFPHLGFSLIALDPKPSEGLDLSGYDAAAVAGPDSPIAMVVGFVLEPARPDPMGHSTWPGENGTTYALVLWFFDRDPADEWSALLDRQAAVAVPGIGRVVWSSSFIATVVGTDTYIDDLWP